jgi:hypothetical protein
VEHTEEDATKDFEWLGGRCTPFPTALFLVPAPTVMTWPDQYLSVRVCGVYCLALCIWFDGGKRILVLSDF